MDMSAVRAAEASGLIDDLTMWVITSAIQACHEFQVVQPDFTVSINISPSNLREADLPHYVDRELRTWNVQASSIVIEITESAMMVEDATSREALRELKNLGLKLSVDDFGTGYSSMQYLAQLPLDVGGDPVPGNGGEVASGRTTAPPRATRRRGWAAGAASSG